jgi:RNA polymerase sigma-70 factor, ECF subfamily
MLVPPNPAPVATSLLARVADGDEEAIREVIATYGALVYSIARRFERQDPEDAVQEIFVDLWKSAARFDPAIASEPTFVAMLARRRLIDRKRRVARRPVSESLEHLPIVVDSSSGPELAAEAALAARALDRLPPDQRQVVLLTVCHGLSHSEVASHLALPLGTVKAHARRGLIAIRAALFIERSGDLA